MIGIVLAYARPQCNRGRVDNKGFNTVNAFNERERRLLAKGSEIMESLKNLPLSNKIILGSLLIIMFYLTVDGIIKRHYINKCYKVAVATLKETYYKKTGQFATLQFSYKNKIITKDYQSITGSQRYFTGKKYYVKISCNNDSLSIVDWDTPVADSLSINPSNGWPSQLIYSY